VQAVFSLKSRFAEVWSFGKRKETSDKADSKCGSDVPVQTAENLRPAILGFLVPIENLHES